MQKLLLRYIARISFTIAALTVLAAALLFLAGRQLNREAASRLENRLHALQEKTGIKILGKEFSTGFSSFRLRSLKIILPKGPSANKNRRLTVGSSDRNPAAGSSDQNPMNLLHQIEPTLKSLLRELQSISTAPENTSLIPRIARWILPKRVVFDIDHIEILAGNETATDWIFHASDFHVRIDRRTPRLNFHARELQLTGFLLESQVSGHVRMWPKTGEIELTASQTPDSRFHGWGFRIRTEIDVKKFHIDLNGAHMPPSLASMLGTLIVPSTDTTFEVSLNLKRLGVEMLAFDATLNFRDLYLRDKNLAASDVGPLHLDGHLAGSFDPGSSELIIDHARVELPAPIDFEPAQRNLAQRSKYDFEVSAGVEPAVIINLRGNGPLPLSVDANRVLTSYFPPKSRRQPPETWSVQALVARTPCQALVDVVPAKLAPVMHQFELTGDFMGVVDLKWRPNHPADFDLKITHDEFTCAVSKEPGGYAAENFNGPVKMERGSRGLPQRDIDLTPQNPAYAPFGGISRNFITTVVAAEDTGFWSHKGVTSHSFLDALRDNLTEGRLTRGGSTITMQLVKNLLLSPERTASRKVQEFFLAWHLGRKISHERILELYANAAEFGPNVFGIGEAADLYFGKKAADLTLKESVFLVNLLPAPVTRVQAFCRRYQPTENFTKLMNDLLLRMHTLKRISVTQLAQARAEKIFFRSDNAAREKLCLKAST